MPTRVVVTGPHILWGLDLTPIRVLTENGPAVQVDNLDQKLRSRLYHERHGFGPFPAENGDERGSTPV